MHLPSSEIKTTIITAEVRTLRKYRVEPIPQKIATANTDRNALHYFDRKQNESPGPSSLGRGRIRTNSRNLPAFPQTHQSREVLAIRTTASHWKRIRPVLLHLWAVASNSAEILGMQRILYEAIGQIEVHTIPRISTCPDIRLSILITW